MWSSLSAVDVSAYAWLCCQQGSNTAVCLQMKEHKERECPKRVIHCPMGCSDQVREPNLPMAQSPAADRHVPTIHVTTEMDRHTPIIDVTIEMDRHTPILDVTIEMDRHTHIIDVTIEMGRHTPIIVVFSRTFSPLLPFFSHLPILYLMTKPDNGDG